MTNQNGSAVVICVDGPAASGKSTVSKEVAKRIGCLYVDSGALYRIATWKALDAGVDTSDADAVATFIDTLDIDFVVTDGRVAYLVDGQEPGAGIRTPEINRHVSPVSAVPHVREVVTAWLRDMRKLGNLIVEGRDIGSVVFPDSRLRFYLDASPDERSRRRHKEYIEKGLAEKEKQSQDEVKASLLNRDRIDSSRKTAPLKIPDGAIFIDTTDLGISDVVDKIVAYVAAENA